MLESSKETVNYGQEQHRRTDGLARPPYRHSRPKSCQLKTRNARFLPPF